jgi:hypothetical protein
MSDVKQHSSFQPAGGHVVKGPQPATTLEDALLEAISKAATEKERAKFHTQLIELRAGAR